MPDNLLHISKAPSEQVLELLEDNCIGTPGKSMLYKHSGVRPKVLSFAKAIFVNLQIRDRLYGTICLCDREVYHCGKPARAFYLRYFSFRKEFRNPKPERKQRTTESRVRDAVADLMNGKGLDFHGNLMLYAYVDPGNVRSGYMAEEFGFKKIGSFKVVTFSRLFPKVNPQVKIADTSQYELIRSALVETYKDMQMVVYENLFKRGKFYILTDRGEVVCGVQAIPDWWEVLDIPGFSGKMLMHVVPKIPLLNRLFKPDFKFVFFEHIFCKPGHADKLGELFESILAEYGVYSAVICQDQKTEVYNMIKANRLGIVHMLEGEKEISVVVKTTDESILSKDKPIHVTGYDVV